MLRGKCTVCNGAPLAKYTLCKAVFNARNSSNFSEPRISTDLLKVVILEKIACFNKAFFVEFIIIKF